MPVHYLSAEAFQGMADGMITEVLLNTLKEKSSTSYDWIGLDCKGRESNPTGNKQLST